VKVEAKRNEAFHAYNASEEQRTNMRMHFERQQLEKDQES